MSTSIESLLKSNGKFLREDEISHIHKEMSDLVEENKKLAAMLNEYKTSTLNIPTYPTSNYPVPQPMNAHPPNMSNYPVPPSTFYQHPHPTPPPMPPSYPTMQSNSFPQMPSYPVIQPNTYPTQATNSFTNSQHSQHSQHSQPTFDEVEKPLTMDAITNPHSMPLQSTPVYPTESSQTNPTVVDGSRTITIIIDTNKLVYLLLFIILMIIILKK
jgi:hypothetical protein